MKWRRQKVTINVGFIFKKISVDRKEKVRRDFLKVGKARHETFRIELTVAQFQEQNDDI